MSYSKTNYLDFLDAVKSYYGSGSDEWVEISKYGLKADNAIEILKQVPNVDILKNSDGSIRSIAYKNFSTKGNRATFLAESIDSNVIGGTSNVKNSFNMNVPMNSKINTATGNLETVSEIGTKVLTGQKIIGTMGKIGAAVFAVGTICTLGKIIDKALYSVNPDFWDAHDMSTLNPDTWASITNSGSLGDDLFNILMGVDPETNETTAYIDENALAYMAWYLQSKDFLYTTKGAKVSEKEINETFPFLKQYLSSDLISGFSNVEFAYGYLKDSYYPGKRTEAVKTSKNTFIYTTKYRNNTEINSYSLYATNSTRFNSGSKTFYGEPPYNTDDIDLDSSPINASFTYNEKKYEIYHYGLGGTLGDSPLTYSVPIITFNVDSDFKVDGNPIYKYVDWLLCNKSVIGDYGKYDGVSNQPDASIPDLSNAKSVEDVLNALRTSNPSLFENAISNSIPQEDGSIKNYTYLPFTLPNTNDANDAEPTTGEQTQAKPKVDPETSPDTLLDLITNLINNKLDTPNTPNTGSGSTPSIVPPVGSASALYKIYNPSQSQLDSFGHWLWSSSFVDQLLKVFNNPMESIIGLHKVYASPVIGGQSNIKVGYLDSGVPSNFVSNQYSKIDCGTVNLLEYFGNVFDYSPYTNIQLYLPCIGFVNLNVGEIMRSKLNIVYTVDVLTGACLAEVNVLRDGCGGVLYSYSGNCASQYPLSSGSYMGIVSSAIGVAGSVIGTVASGGSLAPLALGSMGAVMNAHTNVQHSGSLSGNSGVMGGKIPYLIITRPQTNMPNNYEHYQGIPSNFYTSLSSCNGFTKVKNVDVRNINAESNELDEIKSLLMDGVII